MRKRYNLNRLHHFVAVAEEGSFTGAARRLGLSKAVISKQVLQLESELGSDLFVRTTKQLRLTVTGEAFLEDCRSVIALAGDAFDRATAQASRMSGLLRVTATNSFGTEFVAPAAAKFCREHPDVSIDLCLSDQRFDLIHARFDLAIRTGWLSDSSAIARKIGEFEQVACIAPALLPPKAMTRPRDLSGLPFVANNALKRPLDWTFNRGKGKAEKVSFKRSLSVDSTQAVVAAVVAGGGMSVLPGYMVQQHLDSAALVRVLPEWTLRRGGTFAVFPSLRHKSHLARSFVETLESAITRQRS